MIFIVYKSLIQVGGAEKFLYEFFINLKKYHNVKILCKEYNDEVINFFKINKKDILVPKKNNYVDWFNFLLRNINKDQTIIVQSGFKDIFLVSLLKRIKTILFLHHPYFNSLDHFDLLSFIHNKKRKNFITTSENYKFYQKLKNKAKKNSNYFKTNLNAILIFLSFKKANKIVVLSEYGRREKNEIFNVDPIYIQPAIGQTFIDHANTISEFKKENQIIYFGRLSKEKRVDILIKAFNSIDIDCKLIIIGDGEELANLKDLASKNKKVIFKGFLKDYELFEEIKKSKLMVTLEWADYNLTVYESIILGTRVLFGKTFEIEKSDQKLIENKMLFYCEPSEYEVAKMIKYIFNLEKPEIESFNFLNSNNWENYVKAFLNEVLEEK
jgi:glycosyltransferase involved in cell wall biosynthesis